MGGGTEIHRLSLDVPEGLSPRGRGNLPGSQIRRPSRRSIPAWAGEPTGSRQSRCPFPVYPRVGGGTSTMDGSLLAATGLSPRGRGNPGSQRQRSAACGSIPAWAGEPLPWMVPSWPLPVYPRVGGGTVSYLELEQP